MWLVHVDERDDQRHDGACHDRQTSERRFVCVCGSFLHRASSPKRSTLGFMIKNSVCVCIFGQWFEPALIGWPGKEAWRPCYLVSLIC